MTFDLYETSIEDGRPIRFYRFSMGSAIWRYTTAETPQDIGGATWRPSAITDDGIKQSGDATTDAINITVPVNVGPAAMFASSAPQQVMTAEILESHVGLAALRVIYRGEVVQVNPNRPGVAVITCQTLSATMRRQGLRLGWSRSCDYALYDPLTCKVPKAAHAHATTVTAINGFVVTVASLGNSEAGVYRGGFIEWVHPIQGYNSVTVEAQSTLDLSMFDDPGLLTVGMPVTIYPGCPRTEVGCRRFGNILNYGGCPNMPGKSPFDGIDNPFF
jgi:uncharacterized phage protein (TIGR02218 family)